MSDPIIIVRVIVETEDGEHMVVCRLQDWELQEVRKREVAMQVLWNAYENCKMRLEEKLREGTEVAEGYFRREFERARREMNKRPPEQERPHGWG